MFQNNEKLIFFILEINLKNYFYALYKKILQEEGKQFVTIVNAEY